MPWYSLVGHPVGRSYASWCGIRGRMVVRGRQPSPKPLLCRGEQARLVKTVKFCMHPAGGCGSDRRFPPKAIWDAFMA